MDVDKTSGELISRLKTISTIPKTTTTGKLARINVIKKALSFDFCLVKASLNPTARLTT
jgi:hypothetical protein